MAIAEVREVDAGGVRARLYLPDGYDAVVVHGHGGGFVFNDVEVHDAAVRRFAAIAGAAVLSVDYRRPPEHPFPAAPDDLSAAVGWLGAQGDLAALPTFVHGDSAGGNLALVTAPASSRPVRRRRAGLPVPRPHGVLRLLPHRRRRLRAQRGGLVLAAVRLLRRRPDRPGPRAAAVRRARRPAAHPGHHRRARPAARRGGAPGAAARRGRRRGGRHPLPRAGPRLLAARVGVRRR